jgi:LPXTG-motif cell wall-anchored protein
VITTAQASGTSNLALYAVIVILIIIVAALFLRKRHRPM